MNTITNRRFLEATFIDAMPGTHTMLCGFPGDPNRVGHIEWAGRPWMPGQALPSLIKDYFNNYLTVSTFEADPQDGSRRRRKVHFHSMHAVMIDDVGTKVSHAKMCVRASAMIETSPGNYQAYLFLRQDADSRQRYTCEQLVQRMIKAGLTADSKDPGMAGVTRYGRLPCGVNSKAKYVEKLGRPFPVRCVEFDPSRRYSIGELATAWGLDMTPDRPRAPVIQLSKAQAAHANKRFEALLRFFEVIGRYRGLSSAGWHEIVCPWVDEHTDPTATGTALAEPSAENNFAGGFRCHHGHCNERSMANVWAFVNAFTRLTNQKGSF